MTLDELRKKVEAAEQKVEKCKKTIERHTAQMEKKAKQLQAMGIDPETADRAEFVRNGRANFEAYDLLCDYDYKKEDIKNATKKLAEAERICGNWTAKLDEKINQEKMIQDQVPEIIKEFLEKWKEDAFKWYVDRHAKFLDFKADLRSKVRGAKVEALKTLPEYAELRERFGDRLFEGDHFLDNPWPRKPMEVFLKERELDYHSVAKKLSGFADAVVLKMCEFRKEDERLSWLDSILEEEKKDKMLDLFNRVSSITGPITDAKGLSIYAGDLNGVILGEKGAAKVQTISAGGYNIQCFHYRVLIDDVTSKFMPGLAAGKQGLDSLIQSAQLKQIRITKKDKARADAPER